MTSISGISRGPVPEGANDDIIATGLALDSGTLCSAQGCSTMTEILSQEEIDALLSALDVSEIEEDRIDPGEGRRVKEYDFRRPDKFSKDQIRSLHMIMDSFCRHWSTFLSGKLRSMVYLEVASIDQLPYEEFIRSTFTPSVMAIISMEPLEGSAILDISPPVAFAIIERLVGGSGETLESVRELTEIEEALIETVVADALRVLRTAMEEIIQIDPRLQSIEYNPQFTQIVPPSDMTLFVSLEMRIEGNRGMIGICLPHMLLEPILPDLSTERFFRREKEEAGEGQDRTGAIVQTLGSTELDVRVEVGRVDLSMGEVLHLSPGDIITLPTRLHEPLRVYIGGDLTPRFLARPGLIGQHKGIEIMDFSEE